MDDKPGAKLGDMSTFMDEQEKKFFQATEKVLAMLERCVAAAVNKRDAGSLEAMQTCCGELFRRAAECFASDADYKSE